jgi:hypothetical protein
MNFHIAPSKYRPILKEKENIIKIENAQNPPEADQESWMNLQNSSTCIGGQQV